MDDIVDQSVLGNALQRISELERIAQHQLHTDPPRAEAANQTNATNAVEELYQRFPSLRRQSSSQESVASASTSRRSLSSTRGTSSSTTFTTPPTSAMTRPTSRSRTLRNPRSTSVNTNGNKTKTKTKPVLRDLVLMPDPGETAVPTHTRRVLLDSQGFVIHSFPFERQWDGLTLKRKIEEAFPNHTWLIFEYMKVSLPIVYIFCQNRINILPYYALITDKSN